MNVLHIENCYVSKVDALVLQWACDVLKPDVRLEQWKGMFL